MEQLNLNHPWNKICYAYAQLSTKECSGYWGGSLEELLRGSSDFFVHQASDLAVQLLSRTQAGMQGAALRPFLKLRVCSKPKETGGDGKRNKEINYIMICICNIWYNIWYNISWYYIMRVGGEQILHIFHLVLFQHIITSTEWPWKMWTVISTLQSFQTNVE